MLCLLMFTSQIHPIHHHPASAVAISIHQERIPPDFLCARCHLHKTLFAPALFTKTINVAVLCGAQITNK